MGKRVFVDWELWQQMSFCLGAAMVVVVFIGIGRLKYLTWKSKRVQLEDEEKKARLRDVRRTGLRAKRVCDIPFGVRAIESGIEVDGIWISRPTTPATPQENRYASLTSLVTDDQDSVLKNTETGEDLIDTRSPPTSPRLSPTEHYRPKPPSHLRNNNDNRQDTYFPRTGSGSGITRSSASLVDTDLVGAKKPETYRPHQAATQQQQRPGRDSPANYNTSHNVQTPEGVEALDPFTNPGEPGRGPAMGYTTEMAQPPPTFAPGHQRQGSNRPQRSRHDSQEGGSMI